MTIKYIQKRLKEITDCANDSEAAHSLEDAILIDVLTAIAGGSSNAQKLAKEVLKVEKISFERWCA